MVYGMMDLPVNYWFNFDFWNRRCLFPTKMGFSPGTGNPAQSIQPGLNNLPQNDFARNGFACKNLSCP